MTTSDPFPFDDGPTVDDLTPRDREILDEIEDESPAPELSVEERATVDRFEDPSNAANLDGEIEVDAANDAHGAYQEVDPEAPYYDPDPAGPPYVHTLGPGSGPTFTTEVVPRNMTLDVDGVLDELVDIVKRQTVTAGMKDAIRHTLRVRGDERRKAREDRLDGDPVKSATDVRKELVGAARDAEVLEALAGVFAAGAKEAKGIVGDTLDELPERGGKKRASAKVGEDDSSELKITRASASKLSTKDEDLDDVLAAIVLAVTTREHAEGDAGPLELGKRPEIPFAAGVRAGIAILRSLLGATPGYKSTALDALVTTVEGLDEDELAKRLRKSYGKVPTGEPSIKIEHVAVKGDES